MTTLLVKEKKYIVKVQTSLGPLLSQLIIRICLGGIWELTRSLKCLKSTKALLLQRLLFMYCLEMVNMYSINIFLVPSTCYGEYLDINIEMYNDKIGKIIGGILHESDVDPDKASCFMDLISVLDSAEMSLNRAPELIKGTCRVLKSYTSNEGLCSKCLGATFSRLNEKECKSK